MPRTYEPIATTSLTSATTSITFSSISSAYTDLVLIISAKNTTSLNNGKLNFNGDGGTNYSGTYMQGAGTAVTGRVSNTSSVYLMEFVTTDFSPVVVNIMDYSNTNTYKTILAQGGANSDRIAFWTSIWRSTSAINSIEIATFGGQFASGSTFSLYGIAAA